MQWLNGIVHSFIMAFGITKPGDDKKQSTNIIIGSMLLLVMIGFVGAILFGVHCLAR
jgi:hypothetical protein